MTKFIAFTMAVLVSCSSMGQLSPIDTDRPDQTESASLVPRHYFQGEFGFNKENSAGENYDLVHPTALLKYGFGKTELRLEINSRSSYEHLIPNPKWTSGFDPVEIGFKRALWEEKKLRPKTSLIVHAGLPFLGSKAFRPDNFYTTFRFTCQHSLTDHIGLGYNFGGEWDGNGSAPAWIYTLSPGFTLGTKWYAYIELFGEVKKAEKPLHSFDGGIAYYFSPDTKMDISGGFGISSAAPKSYVALGFSFRVKTTKN